MNDWLLFQIPEEEKNLGPHDRLIHVYHFTRDPNQNQMASIMWLTCWPIFSFRYGFQVLLIHVPKKLICVASILDMPCACSAFYLLIKISQNSNYFLLKLPCLDIHTLSVFIDSLVHEGYYYYLWNQSFPTSNSIYIQISIWFIIP